MCWCFCYVRPGGVTRISGLCASLLNVAACDRSCALRLCAFPVVVLHVLLTVLQSHCNEHCCCHCHAVMLFLSEQVHDDCQYLLHAQHLLQAQA